MPCQSKHIRELTHETPFSARVGSLLLNTAVKAQADLLVGLGRKSRHYLVRSRRGAPESAEPVTATPSVERPFGEGDVVRVRSKDEIMATLDNRLRLGGCYFLDDMWPYCDRELVVEKRVRRFFDERTHRTFRTDDVVLLRGSGCPGNIHFSAARCERSCLFFWKDAWLTLVRPGHGTAALEGEPAPPGIMDAPGAGPETAALAPGDQVRIRSRAEIAATLDDQGMFDGCLFMSTMEEFCGREFRVERRVESFFDEHTYTMAKCRDVVILSTPRCSGRLPELDPPCDKACSLLWKEAWLQKLPAS